MLDRPCPLRLAAVLVALVAVAPASRADAQQLSLQIQNGLVTLTADNVPLRDVLREWGRVTGAVIVNGDKVENQPVTLRLVDAQERAALATLLRNVSGYVLASRPDTSAIDRILILPGRPAVGAPAAAGTNQPRQSDSLLQPLATGGAQTPVALGGRPAVEAAPTDATEELVEGAVASTLAPRDQRPPSPVLRPSEAPDAANPFGKVPGSATPGVITPANAPAGLQYPIVTNPTLGRSQDGSATTR